MYVNVGAAKNNKEGSGSGVPKAEPTAMTQEQIDLTYQLCREKVPIYAIVQMMGVGEGNIDPLELKRVIVQAEISIEASRMEGECLLFPYEGNAR